LRAALADPGAFAALQNKRKLIFALHDDDLAERKFAHRRWRAEPAGCGALLDKQRRLDVPV
jgi:hypothetical protein